MKAIWFEETGNAADVLICGDRETPSPGPGEVLVRLYSSAPNPSDVKKRAGLQPPGFEDGYVIPHSDGAGVIEAVGDGVADRSGERVWVYQAQFQRHQGTCAQYVCVPSELAAPLPDRAGFDVGACIGIPVMTAHRCVYNVGDPAGKTILVTGGSGRVGYYAVQWAKLGGARVITTAGSDARCEIAAGSGADEVLNYRTENLVERLTGLCGTAGIDHIVDVEFGLNVETSAAVLNTNGTISTYSSSLDPQPAIPFYPLMFKNISVHMVLVYNMPDEAKREAIADIHEALSNDRLNHRIAETWSLEETARAHESIEKGGKDGCVVINID